MPENIIKRNGQLETWDETKIELVVKKVLKSNKVEDIGSDEIVSLILKKINGSKTIHQEQVQDIVESALMESGLYEVAKQYIIYREKRAMVRNTEHLLLDVNTQVGNYLNQEDWLIKENCNMTYSYQNLMMNISGAVQSSYMLSMLSEKIREAHMKGFIHIHDLSFLNAYCAGWSLTDLLLEGFNRENQSSSDAPKHFDTALSQMVNFLGCLQLEFSGAQAFNNVSTLLAPFIRHDGLNVKQVKQFVQRFVYNMNVPSRWGGQAVFSNITIDLNCPEHLKTNAVIIGGKLHESWVYGEFQAEIDMFNLAFMEVMQEGDRDGRVFTFPIPTFNIDKNVNWESDVMLSLCEMTAKYGIPYFQNFINSDIAPEDVMSMCCRLRLDKKKIRKKTGGLFGAGDKTGSIGVVTINLAKLGYVASDEREFFELIDYYMEQAKNSLEFKRKFIDQQMIKGLYPWAKRYLGDKGFAGHFSTIGVIGGNEACLNLKACSIDEDDGYDFMCRVLDYMAENCQRYEDETTNLYNLEATPAEGTSRRLAHIDKDLYGEKIITSGTNKDPFYTNSTQFHPDSNHDLVAHIQKQEALQCKYTGGTVFHSYIGEQISDPKVVATFIKTVFTQTKIPYLSVTPTFSICLKHGYIAGDTPICPECGAETEVYTRVVGYLRPQNRMNSSKLQEFSERIFYGKNGKSYQEGSNSAKHELDKEENGNTSFR